MHVHPYVYAESFPLLITEVNPNQNIEYIAYTFNTFNHTYEYYYTLYA
jgi:hypothetical protein